MMSKQQDKIPITISIALPSKEENSAAVLLNTNSQW